MAEKRRGVNIPRIGAHVSVAGGISNAFAKAQAIGAECIQIFGSSPRQWQVRYPTEDEVKKFKELNKSTGIGPVFLHAAYLTNLASPNDIIRTYTIESLGGHLKIAEMIGADGLIFHIGSGKGMPEEEATQLVAEGMEEVLRRVPGKTHLIMENTAGGGNRLGGIDDMRRILAATDGQERVRACLDTAHLFEGGLLDFSSLEVVTRYFDEWEQQVGFSRLVAIHVNDSKTAFGSKHDRHENIGEGYIRIEGFKKLAQEKRLHAVPWIIETPGFDEQGPDAENIQRLRSCFT